MLTANKTIATIGGCAIALLAIIVGGIGIARSRPPALASSSQPAQVLDVQTIANWQPRFNAVYRLDDGEALKNIPTPYIPERQSYYTINQPKLAQLNPNSPPIYIFEWDNGRLMRWGTLSGENSRTVSILLAVILRLKPYEFEGPPEFLYHRISGDWIRRINSTPEQRLDALCRIVQRESGPSMHFVQRRLSRPALIASGEFSYRPPQGTFSGPQSVHLFIDDADLSDPGRSAGSDTLNEVIEELASTLNMPLMSTIKGGDAQITDRNHKVNRIDEMPGGLERDQAIQRLLKHVQEQTNLSLTIEPREIPVWVAEPGSNSP